MAPSHDLVRDIAARPLRAVVLAENPVAPYSRALRMARALHAEGFAVEIAATARPGLETEEITPDYVTRRLVIAGTVNSVVDQILKFRETTGDFGTLLYACHDWMDPALGRRSMQLMAEEVMPRVNAAIRES